MMIIYSWVWLVYNLISIIYHSLDEDLREKWLGIVIGELVVNLILCGLFFILFTK